MNLSPQEMFTEEDIRQIEEHGLTVEQVMDQIQKFMKPPPFLRLERPCTIGDGITVIPEERHQTLTDLFEPNRLEGRFMKFVPASGAATRMFKALQKFYNQPGPITKEMLKQAASRGDKDAAHLLEFLENLEKFAFFDQLKAVVAQKGLDIHELLKKERLKEVLGFILNPDGLGYGNIPKALIPFHRYNGHTRTAFEEHLVEAANYVADAKGNARIHFTVALEHKKRFQEFLETVRPIYEKELGVRYVVDFSIQKPSTDTIAVDMENRPFRLPDGRLLFRPGGHGALIENLNDLNADLVFIKNIDNVAPDHLKPETYKWKKILGGLLIEVEGKVHSYLSSISRGEKTEVFLQQVMIFLEEELGIHLPDHLSGLKLDDLADYLFGQLNRPIRVCGMVKNVGEPGGGPFWVKDKSGRISRQIVEVAQINMEDPDQRSIFERSTHFNPVDLVCSVRDWEGKPFDLRRFVDPDAVFITQKSKDGKDLKALELPGLWNGAMAHWITIFVEVPLITFNPVKTVNALLRREHQPPIAL